jgi:hypothetical protein
MPYPQKTIIIDGRRCTDYLWAAKFTAQGTHIEATRLKIHYISQAHYQVEASSISFNPNTRLWGANRLNIVIWMKFDYKTTQSIPQTGKLHHIQPNKVNDHNPSSEPTEITQPLRKSELSSTKSHNVCDPSYTRSRTPQSTPRSIEHEP